MKTNTSESSPFVFKDIKDFYDFTFFSEVVVRPGAVLTPRDALRRTRISSLRRRASRSPQGDAWGSVLVAFVRGCANRKPPQEAKNPGMIAEVEDEHWLASARRARQSWMDENAY